jgi:hypothetical protein
MKVNFLRQMQECKIDPVSLDMIGVTKEVSPYKEEIF